MEQTHKEREWLNELNRQIEHVAHRYNEFVRWSKRDRTHFDTNTSSHDGNEGKKISHGLSSIFEKLHRGFSNILTHLEEIQKTEPLALSSDLLLHIAEMITIATAISIQQEIIVDHVANGSCLQQAIGIPDESIESLYQAGRYFYDNQLYEEAAIAFTLLSLINPTQGLFWASLGNCEYFLGHYRQALMAYALACQTDPHEPQYHIFSAHCHKAMGNKGAALSSLNLAEISPHTEEGQRDVRMATARMKREIEMM